MSVFICLCVRLCVVFFLLVSLKFYLLLKSSNGVLRGFEVSRGFQGCFKEVSRKVQGWFKDVLRVFSKSFNKFKRCFKEASRVLQGSFRICQGCLKNVSRVIQARLAVV